VASQPVPWLIEISGYLTVRGEGAARSAPQQQYDDYDDDDNDNGANTDINWLFLSLSCTSRELP
jgi:hypothetical protein